MTHRNPRLGGKHRMDKDNPQASRLHELGRLDKITLLGMLTQLYGNHGPGPAVLASKNRDQIIADILRLEGK
jgi:hypothetical protein